MTEVILDPDYLRSTASLIKEIAGSSRLVRRDLWNFWLSKRGDLAQLDLEARRQVLGEEMHRRGHNGFGRYSRIGK